MTTQPNRYSTFSVGASAVDRDGIVTVRRIALPAHQSGMLDQSRAFLRFARGAAEFTRGDRYDVVFATSSRLMTAGLGAWIARRAGSRLYLDIRDIFVDTIKDIAPRTVAWALNPVFGALERWTVSRAQKVNLVSRGFASYFAERYPDQRLSYYSNAIDDEFLTSAPLTASAVMTRTEPLTVVYAGNVGEGQGLHAILPALAKETDGRLRFRIIGDGGRRKALEAALRLVGARNVELIAPVTRQRLIAEYREADLLLLHLNEHDAFKRVLPSKLFEYAAMGKPIWAGVAGYAAEFISREVTNAAVFAPCDVRGAIAAIDTLYIGDCPRDAFVRRYARARISREMASDVIAIGEGR